MTVQWTMDRIALLRRMYPSRPTAEVAVRLKCSEKAVSAEAGRRGLKKNKTRRSEAATENIARRWRRSSRRSRNASAGRATSSRTSRT
jgi:hypothetical protein